MKKIEIKAKIKETKPEKMQEYIEASEKTQREPEKEYQKLKNKRLLIEHKAPKIKKTLEKILQIVKQQSGISYETYINELGKESEKIEKWEKGSITTENTENI